MSKVTNDISTGGIINTWLQEFPDLHNINDRIWDDALSAAKIVSFPAGKVLIECGDSADKFVIVLRGLVKVFETAENGREICLYRVFPGQACALTLTKLLKGNANCAQAIAEEDTTLLVIPERYFRQLMDQSTAFRNYLLKSMANALTEVMQLVADVSFRRLELRLACMIGRRGQDGGLNRLNMTHQDIANELGTTREVVSRLLKELEHMGCVKLSRGNIEIVSGEALQRLSS